MAVRDAVDAGRLKRDEKLSTPVAVSTSDKRSMAVSKWCKWMPHARSRWGTLRPRGQDGGCVHLDKI
jgi:hypothetical protein